MHAAAAATPRREAAAAAAAVKQSDVSTSWSRKNIHFDTLSARSSSSAGAALFRPTEPEADRPTSRPPARSRGRQSVRGSDKRSPITAVVRRHEPRCRRSLILKSSNLTAGKFLRPLRRRHVCVASTSSADNSVMELLTTSTTTAVHGHTMDVHCCPVAP